MGVDPAEWHSFGDSAPAQQEASAVAGKAAPAKAARGWPAPQTAWLAVGGTIVTAIVGIVVFFTAVAVSGNQGSDVVIAARPSAVSAGQSHGPVESASVDPAADSLGV